MKVSILGTGAYGIAIASALAKNNHEVYMWSESNEKIKEWQKTGSLKSVMENYEFPKNIKVSGNMQEVLKDTEIIFMTCASRFIWEVSNNIKDYYHKKTPICIASKGIEDNTCQLLSNVVKETLKTKNIAVISGPTFAIDMVNNEPVALAIASNNSKTQNTIANALSNDTLKLRKSKDMIGVQICGSVKNIIAIASGILGGLGYSESTQAFLINESLHDIKDLIFFLGGKPKTILSFAGVGDLLMTSMSKKSRNYSFGYVIGSTGDIAKIKDFREQNTVEGYFTTKIVLRLLDKRKIEIPLITLINDIIDGKKDPHDLADFLINKK
ncbi:MAG: NAD(P)H-dependent glycerol-3-phosphate dehydrogenase [Firmicutes bacterium]|nr:NAD(P)H-dependent glycerol-3-phosphate dehydrogenase [Bacillota bacterium]